MSIVDRLRGAVLDKDNFPRMDSERWLPVGLAKEAADEIERLTTALRRIVSLDDKNVPKYAKEIAREVLKE